MIKTVRLLSKALLVGCLGIVTNLPGQSSDCIDLKDLYAPHIHCTWGTYENPYLYQGVAEGHHTVITDLLATDPQTQHQLQMVPFGETYSIMLGNASGGSAESISVDMSIDTSQFDLLFLKYAAVLENPNHGPLEQPKFTFEILDMQDQPIDTVCLFAVFVSNINLGWNQNGPFLWKDWTHVGVDLTELHGQTIRVRLTTYDCAWSKHFGYAYFLLTCGNKIIRDVSCGSTETYTFSAPYGFNYRWYWQDNPWQTISTDQTVSVPSSADGVLMCHASFIGNESCGFDLSTTMNLENSYPVAGFGVEETDCPQKIRFLNESFVSNDGVNPDGTGYHCEDILWDFGDGYTSSAFCPTHKYTQAGDFTVTMVAGLGGFQCTDTERHTVHIPEDTRVDTLACDAYEWNGTLLTESGVYSHSYPVGDGCDSLVALYLTVVKSDAYEVDTAACDRYVWNDSVYTLSGSYTQVFPRTDRCDSIVTTRLDLNYAPEFGVVGPHYVIGGSEWEFTEHAYTIAIDNPLCHIDTVVWSVDCPNMTIQPIGDGTSARLRVFTLLAPNDSVALHATAYNRCGAVERTFWIHTTYYDVDEQADNVRDLAVFPNPNTGLFTLRMKGFSGHVAITVYNAEGLKVMAWEEDGMPDEAVLPVDCSRLRDGIYTFRVHNETAALAKKIVISR